VALLVVVAHQTLLDCLIRRLVDGSDRAFEYGYRLYCSIPPPSLCWLNMVASANANATSTCSPAKQYAREGLMTAGRCPKFKIAKGGYIMLSAEGPGSYCLAY
jgi:hypothetical protein